MAVSTVERKPTVADFVNRLLDMFVFYPNFVSRRHEEAFCLPKSHPYYVSKEQALRPWTLPANHRLYVAYRDKYANRYPDFSIRWICRRPLQLIANGPSFNVGDKRVDFYRDESGIVWMCTNKWGWGKMTAISSSQVRL